MTTTTGAWTPLGPRPRSGWKRPTQRKGSTAGAMAIWPFGKLLIHDTNNISFHRLLRGGVNDSTGYLISKGWSSPNTVRTDILAWCCGLRSLPSWLGGGEWKPDDIYVPFEEALTTNQRAVAHSWFAGLLRFSWTSEVSFSFFFFFFFALDAGYGMPGVHQGFLLVYRSPFPRSSFAAAPNLPFPPKSAFKTTFRVPRLLTSINTHLSILVQYPGVQKKNEHYMPFRPHKKPLPRFLPPNSKNLIPLPVPSELDITDLGTWSRGRCWCRRYGSGLCPWICSAGTQSGCIRTSAAPPDPGPNLQRHGIVVRVSQTNTEQWSGFPHWKFRVYTVFTSHFCPENFPSIDFSRMFLAKMFMPWIFLADFSRTFFGQKYSFFFFFC